MSNKKEQKKEALVPSGKRQIEKYSSKIVSRGLGLIKIVEKKKRCDLLIVEDEESIRYLIGKIIQDRFPNLRIQSAEDGLKGLEKVKAFKPRIVWTCVKLPRMSGLEMIELIRKSPDLKNTKIILFTACYSMEDVRKDAFELGVDIFLPKGVKTTEDAASWVLRCIAFKTNDTRTSRYREAVKAYKEAISINPDYYEAHYALGCLYGELGCYTVAIKAFNQAVRISPNDYFLLCDLGMIYRKSGRFKEAIDVYIQAIRIHPDYAKAHYGLGLVYLEIKDKNMTIEQYKILKNLDVEKANELLEQIYK